MEKAKKVERQISFILTNDQLEILCNHFGVILKNKKILNYVNC